MYLERCRSGFQHELGVVDVLHCELARRETKHAGADTLGRVEKSSHIRIPLDVPQDNRDIFHPTRTGAKDGELFTGELLEYFLFQAVKVDLALKQRALA